MGFGFRGQPQQIAISFPNDHFLLDDVSPIFAGDWRMILRSLGNNYFVSSDSTGVSTSGGVLEMGGPLASSMPLSPSPMDRGGEDHGDDFGTPSGSLASSPSAPSSSMAPSGSSVPSDRVGPSDFAARSDSAVPSGSASPPFWSKIRNGKAQQFLLNGVLILLNTLDGF